MLAKKLLAVLGRSRQVECPPRLLDHPALFQTQPAGLLLTDPGQPAAEVAGPFGVVGVPPATRPAGPVAKRVDTPGEAALAGADAFGAAGMAAGAQALAEVVRAGAARATPRRCERPAGEALVAIVHPGPSPCDVH